MLRISVYLLACAWLAACTGSADVGDAQVGDTTFSIEDHTRVDDVVSPHFEGVWFGTVKSATRSWHDDVIVLVNGWGEARFLTGSSQWVGVPRIQNGAIDATLTGISHAGEIWPIGDPVATLTVRGTYGTDKAIAAEYTGGGDAGTVRLSSAENLPPGEVENIAGLWVQRDEDGNSLASISIDVRDRWVADLFGQHRNGCTYSGAVEGWTSRDLFDIESLEVSGCPAYESDVANGAYSGTAGLIDLPGDAADEIVLVIALSNDDASLVLVLEMT